MTVHYHEPPLPFEGGESDEPSTSNQPHTPKQGRYRRRPSIEDPRSRQLKEVTRQRLARTPEEVAAAQESAHKGVAAAREALRLSDERAAKEAEARLRLSELPEDKTTSTVPANPDEPSQPWLDEHEWARQDSFKNEDSTNE